MKNFGKWALCLLIGCAAVAFLTVPVLAEHGWTEDPPQKGKPEDPPNPTMAPTYYGQPMMFDDSPWSEDRGKKKGPDFEASSPYTWWMQMAVDENPWGEKPPKPGKPEPE